MRRTNYSLKGKYMKWQSEHPNFMTPNVEELFTKGKKVVELSSGRRMFSENKLMYGVSPSEFIGGEKQFRTIQDKGKPFYNKKKAKSFAIKLLGEI